MSDPIGQPVVYHKKKHRKPHHEEHHEGEPWLVSYADMMTLLFCFFVIMTSFANFDPVVVTKKSSEVADHFQKGKEADIEKAFQGLGIQIGGHPNLKGIAKSEIKEGTLEIVFSSSMMFSPGDVEINSEFMKNLDIVISLIKNRNPDYRIMVEGHTDDLPLSLDHHYRSNWELASARAATVVERFLYYNFKPTQMVSVGFGDSRPVAPNKDKYGQNIPENQALNRRVVVKVLKPLGSSKMKQLGIDTYFEESEILKK
ncbi:MAG: OmpA family protein [Bacteriovorax sp.]|nr:OmpA family protein [Bacteriovorax sp.]